MKRWRTSRILKYDPDERLFPQYERIKRVCQLDLCRTIIGEGMYLVWNERAVVMQHPARHSTLFALAENTICIERNGANYSTGRSQTSVLKDYVKRHQSDRYENARLESIVMHANSTHSPPKTSATQQQGGNITEQTCGRRPDLTEGHDPVHIRKSQVEGRKVCLHNAGFGIGRRGRRSTKLLVEFFLALSLRPPLGIQDVNFVVGRYREEGNSDDRNSKGCGDQISDTSEAWRVKKGKAGWLFGHGWGRIDGAAKPGGRKISGQR